jgi:hypothetical protein
MAMEKLTLRLIYARFDKGQPSILMNWIVAHYTSLLENFGVYFKKKKPG